jgi:hypothetical protein
MMRFFPRHPRRFGGDLFSEPSALSASSTQHHLIKHVFGLNALLSGTAKGARHWNAEGWDSTQPPVLTVDQRRVLVAGIRALAVDGNGCAIPDLERETAKGGANVELKFCQTCPQALRDECVRITAEVADRYFGSAETILDAVGGEHSIAVPRQSVWLAATNLFSRSRQSLVPLVVFTAGWAGEERDMLVARFSAFSGLRLEFYMKGRSLSWRTTYRSSDRMPGNFLKFAIDTRARPNSTQAHSILSDSCLVPRPWWEAHGQL